MANIVVISINTIPCWIRCIFKFVSYLSKCWQFIWHPMLIWTWIFILLKKKGDRTRRQFRSKCPTYDIFNFQIHVLISNSQTQSIINSYSCKTLTLINHVQERLIWYPNISILSFDPTVKFTKPPHSAITFKGET